MAKAQKLPSGSYRCKATVTVNGKQITQSFTVSPKETMGDAKKAKALAELKAREWLTHKEKEQIFSQTVESAINGYIEDRCKILSPSTIHSYLEMVKYFDSIKDMYTCDVTTQVIQRLINDMVLDVSPKTIRNRIGFLIAVLDYAGNEKKFKLRYPQKKKRELRTPDHADVHKLIEYADEKLKPIIVIAALGGLRRGEIAGLKQKDIIRDMSMIYVHADMVRSPGNKFVYKDLAKTAASTRSVHLSPKIIDLLPTSEDPESFVFNLSPTAISRRFEKLRDKLKIDCSLHDLRHYATSMRSDLGIDEKYIRDELGWTSKSQVYSEVYNNPLKSTSKKYIQMTNSFIDERFGDLMAQ